MEISEITKASQIQKIQKKGSISTSQIEDSIHISPEAEKRIKWVDMLKKMPEVRAEKMESALTSSYSQEVNRVVAQKLTNEII